NVEPAGQGPPLTRRDRPPHMDPRRRARPRPCSCAGQDLVAAQGGDMRRTSERVWLLERPLPLGGSHCPRRTSVGPSSIRSSPWVSGLMPDREIQYGYGSMPVQGLFTHRLNDMSRVLA